MGKEAEELFDVNDTVLETERQQRKPKHLNWRPAENQSFSLTIPPTVYPPREDTDLMAKRLIQLGPGKGRKFLEIGCGSGALSILAGSLGWSVHGCDINPFAVVATRGNLEKNMQTGVILEGGVGPESFPFDTKFDLIIWNLPYIFPDEVNDVLGPMEEAALIDTDKVGLYHRLMATVEKNGLLAINGKILLLARYNSLKSDGKFAIRIWDIHTFEDGEKLAVYCLWRPYEHADKSYVDVTGSTNDDLMQKIGIGTHISTRKQTAGRGRRSRKWHSIERSYAGSWIVAEGRDINPGLLQLSGGLAVLNSIGDDRLKLKWPNDIMIEGRKLCGILVEGRTSNNQTKAVLGIGINLETKQTKLEGIEISSLAEIKDLSFEELDQRLECEISSLIEYRDDLPPVDYEKVRSQVLEHMKIYGKPEYQGKVFESFDLNERGELVLEDTVIDDGEDVNWI